MSEELKAEELRARVEQRCHFNCDAESNCNCPAHIGYRLALAALRLRS